MNPSNFSPRANEAITAFDEQLAKLIALRESTSTRQDRNFIRWHSLTTEIFKRFLPNSEYFSFFETIPFEPGRFEMPIPDSDPRSPFNRGCEAARGCLESAIEHIRMFGLDSPSSTKAGVEIAPAANHGVSVLISHSAKDEKLAAALINLLRTGLGLHANQIRCTSVDGYRLPAGVNTNDQLRREINTAQVLIGLLTPNSLASTYVLFELGARWGAGRFMIPLLAGISAAEMRGPDSVLNALSCDREAQLLQLVDDIGRELNIAPESAASYFSTAHEIKTLSESIVTPSPQNRAREAPGSASPANSANSSVTPNHTAERKRELIRVLTALRGLQAKVLHWRDLANGKWGLVRDAEKLLPDDLPAILYEAGEINPDLRAAMEVVGSKVTEAESLIVQFIGQPPAYKQVDLMTKTYRLLDEAVPPLSNVIAEVEAFERKFR